MPNKITSLLLGLAIALVLGVCWQVSRIAPEIVALIRQRGDDVGTVNAEWTSGGVVIHFKSTREATETPTEFAERAAAEYAALRVAFPPDNDH